MRKKENRSQREREGGGRERERVEKSRVYRAEQNWKKKMRRQRSQKKRTDHAETIRQSGRGPKQIYKGGPKKQICEMKNEENEVQREQFYAPRPDQHPSLKKANQDSLKVPTIMTSGVKKTLKEMKNNKAPGIDNLTRDVMTLGGEKSVKQIFF